MNNKIFIAAPAAMAMVLLCGCTKKQGNFDSSYFNTVPTPLETVGENVPATVNGSLPAKFIQKNAKVTATPVLVWNGADASQVSAAGQPVIFQGEDVRANGQVVSYKNGGPVTVPFNVAYQPGMEKSELFLDFNVDQKGKLYTLPRVKVGYGVVSTSTLASAATVKPAIAPDNFQKIITQKYIAQVPWLPEEVWSDHRRLGLPFFENQAVEKDYNPLNQVPLTVATSKECRWDFYPKRYRYPANIQTNNQVGYAQALQLLGGPDLTTTPLWWNAK